MKRRRSRTRSSCCSSTLEIARRLGLVASGVSEHLSALRLAGLVESQRRGRFVYYRLGQTGVALLEWLGSHHQPLEVANL